VTGASSGSGSWTVVDANVLAVALIDDGPDGDLVRKRLIGHRLAAPATIDLEVLAVWHRGQESGALPLRRVDLAAADLTRLPLARVPPVDLIPHCWELLGTVTAADAPYLALAGALDAPLLTSDSQLAARCPDLIHVELLR
jgi:predicted nucleic acid-binding protein